MSHDSDRRREAMKDTAGAGEQTPESAPNSSPALQDTSASDRPRQDTFQGPYVGAIAAATTGTNVEDDTGGTQQARDSLPLPPGAKGSSFQRSSLLPPPPRSGNKVLRPQNTAADEGRFGPPRSLTTLPKKAPTPQIGVPGIENHLFDIDIEEVDPTESGQSFAAEENQAPKLSYVDDGTPFDSAPAVSDLTGQIAPREGSDQPDHDPAPAANSAAISPQNEASNAGSQGNLPGIPPANSPAFGSGATKDWPQNENSDPNADAAGMYAVSNSQIGLPMQIDDQPPASLSVQGDESTQGRRGTHLKAVSGEIHLRKGADFSNTRDKPDAAPKAARDDAPHLDDGYVENRNDSSLVPEEQTPPQHSAPGDDIDVAVSYDWFEAPAKQDEGTKQFIDDMLQDGGGNHGPAMSESQLGTFAPRRTNWALVSGIAVALLGTTYFAYQSSPTNAETQQAGIRQKSASPVVDPFVDANPKGDRGKEHLTDKVRIRRQPKGQNKVPSALSPKRQAPQKVDPGLAPQGLAIDDSSLIAAPQAAEDPVADAALHSAEASNTAANQVGDESAKRGAEQAEAAAANSGVASAAPNEPAKTQVPGVISPNLVTAKEPDAPPAAPSPSQKPKINPGADNAAKTSPTKFPKSNSESDTPNHRDKTARTSPDPEKPEKNSAKDSSSKPKSDKSEIPSSRVERQAKLQLDTLQDGRADDSNSVNKTTLVPASAQNPTPAQNPAQAQAADQAPESTSQTQAGAQRSEVHDARVDLADKPNKPKAAQKPATGSSTKATPQSAPPRKHPPQPRRFLKARVGSDGKRVAPAYLSAAQRQSYLRIPIHSDDRRPMGTVSQSGVYIDQLVLGTGYSGGTCTGRSVHFSLRDHSTAHVCLRLVHQDGQSHAVRIEWIKSAKVMHRHTVTLQAGQHFAHGYSKLNLAQQVQASGDDWSIRVLDPQGMLLYRRSFSVTP